jgi:hypothetical protein
MALRDSSQMRTGMAERRRKKETIHNNSSKTKEAAACTFIFMNQLRISFL